MEFKDFNRRIPSNLFTENRIVVYCKLESERNTVIFGKQSQNSYQFENNSQNTMDLYSKSAYV